MFTLDIYKVFAGIAISLQKERSFDLFASRADVVAKANGCKCNELLIRQKFLVDDDGDCWLNLLAPHN